MDQCHLHSTSERGWSVGGMSSKVSWEGDVMNPNVQRLIDCLYAGHRIVVKGLDKRIQGIAYLQEGLSIASNLGMEKAWVDGASDLAILLLRSQRVSAQDRLKALGLLDQAITIVRRMPQNPNLGLLLTSRAEARMRGGRGRQVLELARDDLEEALPIREKGTDKAYTLSGLGRILHLMPADTAPEQLVLWERAQSLYRTALATFRYTPAEAYSFGLTVVNLCELYCRSWSLKQRISVWESSSSPHSQHNSSLALGDVNLAYSVWSLANLNPSLFDHAADLVDGVPDMRPSTANATVSEEVGDLLAVIDDAQRNVACLKLHGHRCGGNYSTGELAYGMTYWVSPQLML